MSRKPFKPNEAEIVLPAIKVSRSTYNSPRNIINKSPVLDLIGPKSPVPKPLSSLFKPDDKSQILLQDKFTRRISVTPT